MTTVTAYAATSATAPLTKTTITRRDVGPHDVAFDIHFAGICHSDIHTVKGEWGEPLYPVVPGHEIAGVVTAVGSEVTNYKVGDHVGVGCFVDSCRECDNCEAGLEQYCTGTGMVGTYNAVLKDGEKTYGGYSGAIVVDENYVVTIPEGISLDVAEKLLGGGLRGLAGRSLVEVEREHGLGRAKATRILAALELGARLASEGRTGAAVFRTPDESARYLLPRYGARPVETFGLLALDVRHRLKHEAVVSVGCLTSSLVHPREVFQEAVVCRAAALVLFHNHPSGDPEPSAEDVALTRRLAAAGELMGIEVLDHVVLGAGRYVSLKQRGIL